MELQLAAEQKQNLSQRMVQSANILQMNTQELEEYIKQALSPLLAKIRPETAH